MEVNRFEIKELYERLDRGGLAGSLTADDEAEAAAKLAEWVDATTTLQNGATVPVLNIVTSEPMAAYGARADYLETFGTHGNPQKPAFNRLEPVAAIETLVGEKIVEWPDGSLEKVASTRYVARSARYTMPDGRETEDSCSSGPERFERAGKSKKVGQVGAATALLRRLLEAVALN